MRKRVQAWIMALVMLFTTVAVPLMGAESVQAAEDELKIQFHYLREDGNYDGWNIAAWDGASGCQFQKDENGYVTDDKGAVAETVVAPGSKKVGFIVRYSTADDEWAAKDPDGDRFVNVEGYASGTIHAYLVSNQSEFEVDYSEAVEAVEEEIIPDELELSIQFHYLREDGNYDGWNIAAWGGANGAAFQKDENGYVTDENGVVAETVVAPGSKEVGFIVRYSTADDEWAAKDPDGDRFVNVEGYVSGTIHVYLLSGQKEFEVDYSEAVEDELTIQFHYLREDGNYDGWNIAAWDGASGAAFQKDENGYVTDENGAVAETVVTPGSKQVGFIVRYSTADNEWAAKDWDGDRFINTNGYLYGTIHVYLNEGEKDFDVDYSNALKGIYIPPEEPEKGLVIKFHYLREDGEYDGWNIAAWDGASGATFEKDENGYIVDENGAVATSTVEEGATKIGFIVRYSIEGNEWAQKDPDADRWVEIGEYASGTIHVYLVSGKAEFTVDYSEAAKAPLKINFLLYGEKPDKNIGLWIWDDAGADAIYPIFEEQTEDGAYIISYEVASAASGVGFIVRDDDWGKYPDGDRWVDVSTFVGGEITVHLTLNEEEFEVDDENAIKGAKVKKAVYEGDKIVVTTSLPLETTEDVFKVLCEDEEIEITSVVAGEEENTYVITLAEELDRAKAYKVSFGGNMYKVSMPSLYKDDKWIAENTYEGDDLGATWTAEKTTFKVWAPLASEVSVNLYEEGKGGDKISTTAMTKAEDGVWVLEVEGDLNGTYYTYTVNNSGEINEACDPYAVATGVNGDRAMVLDLDSTDPEGWENDTNPNADLEYTDIVLYELHVRDASIDESSGVSEENKGNFLGLTEHGDNTILDHMVDLGITHVHLLPVYDFSSVDETQDGFNWGYDPKNYNVPEGSYSSDPYNGDVRVKEMKEMVQTLHENGISVVMDVVYNHVADAGKFSFNVIVPQYFSRINENGGYSSNSGCGNDTASEHVMVRKYIVESVKYWADEYHIDGFRFDLVGLIDTVTINEIMKEVWSDHPDVVFYGEGWSMNSYDTGVSMTVQSNADEVPGFAFFNDVFRDTIKGSVFDEASGYVSGKEGVEETMIQSFMAASVWGSESTVCPSPLQTVNYNSCHDNNTLYDRLKISRPDASEEDIVKMNNLAAALTLTSQGIPFIHAAEEFLRSKPLPEGGYDHNSYASGDEINSIKWDTLDDNIDTYEYYKGLIEFRKAHPALRMTDAAEVAENIKVIEGLDDNVIAFEITGANGETADRLFVIFNPNTEATTVALPEGEWNIYVNGEAAGTEVLGTATGTATVEAISAMVLVDEADVVADGLVYDEETDAWYYYVDGEVATEYTGLVAYNGSWFYVENGVVNFGYTGLTLYNGTWYYVQGGVLNWEYTGLTLYNGTWYYVQGGILNWEYTGLTEYNGVWYYVQGGILNWEYTGLTLYNDIWFYVQGGILNWEYTGLTLYNDTWFYVQGGILNWEYTGLTLYNGTWYYVEGGILNWGYTGLTEYFGTWYYVEGGILNWSYTGLVYHYGTWYYVGGGILDWTYTGVVEYGGSLWYVENGIMVGAA